MTLSLHDRAKAATLNYVTGYGDVTTAIRDCYAHGQFAGDFSGIVDALATYGPWDKRKRTGELGKRIASLRVLLNRIGDEMQDNAEALGIIVVPMTIESKDGQPLGIVPKRAKAKEDGHFASFIKARRAVHTAISELSALRGVPGFADFHAAALNALNHLEAMPETVEYVTKSVTGVEMQATLHVEG